MCILLEATGSAYTVSNVRNGFVLNGQLDPDTNSVPSLEYLHIYQGNIKGSSLEKRDELVGTYFEEMYTNGCIHEDSYNKNGIRYRLMWNSSRKTQSSKTTKLSSSKNPFVKDTNLSALSSYRQKGSISTKSNRIGTTYNKKRRSLTFSVRINLLTSSS